MSNAQKVDLLISGARVLTMDAQKAELEEASIAIRDGRILDIGPALEFPTSYRAKKTIDARRMLAMPGLINAHNHLFQIMCRGLGDESNLSTWAQRAIWPLAPYFGKDECETAARLACVEMLESGTTTVVDSHYLHALPSAQEGCARACLDVGIRAILGRVAHGLRRRSGTISRNA